MCSWQRGRNKGQADKYLRCRRTGSTPGKRIRAAASSAIHDCRFVPDRRESGRDSGILVPRNQNQGQGRPHPVPARRSTHLEETDEGLACRCPGPDRRAHRAVSATWLTYWLILDGLSSSVPATRSSRYAFSVSSNAWLETAVVPVLGGVPVLRTSIRAAPGTSMCASTSSPATLQQAHAGLDRHPRRNRCFSCFPWRSTIMCVPVLAPCSYDAYKPTMRCPRTRAGW